MLNMFFEIVLISSLSNFECINFTCTYIETRDEAECSMSFVFKFNLGIEAFKLEILLKEIDI
mgnify:CR=1 FL=1